MNILTPEEKQILSLICNYLKSQGMKEGNIEIDMDYGEFRADAVEQYTYFENSYKVEIPNELTKIFKRVAEYVIENDFIREPDVDDVNYERLSISLDAVKRELTFEHYYTYYQVQDTESNSWSEEDYKDEEKNPITEMFDELEKNPNISPKNNLLHLKYNGSGDSGYIEDYFDEGGEVPANIQDWCYRQLENNHGGWENNEGAQGNFVFDVSDNVIELYHEYNVEESKSDTVFEEKF